MEATGPQAIGRNWRLILFAAGGVAAAVALILWYLAEVGPEGKPIPKQQDRAPKAAKLDTSDLGVPGFRREEPRTVYIQQAAPPAPPVTPVSEHISNTTQDRPKKVIDQKPSPKLLVSLSVGDGDKEEAIPIIAPPPQPLAAQELDEGNGDPSRSWVQNAGRRKWTIANPVVPPISRWMLQATTMIVGTTLQEVNSDQPGDFSALVNEPVLDSRTHSRTIIPAGSKLYMTYNKVSTYGQRRAQVAILRIQNGDGSYVPFDTGMPGTDAAGTAGVEGEVDHHVGAMAGAILGTAFFSILGQTGQIVSGGSGQGGPVAIGSVGAQAGTSEAHSIGQQIISKELDRPNTLTIGMGSQVAVMLTKDVGFTAPYTPFVFAGEQQEGEE